MRFHPALYNQGISTGTPVAMPTFVGVTNNDLTTSPTVALPPGTSVDDTVIRNNLTFAPQSTAVAGFDFLAPSTYMEHILTRIATADDLVSGSYVGGQVESLLVFSGVQNVRYLASTDGGSGGGKLFSGYKTVVPNTLVLYLTGVESTSIPGYTGDGVTQIDSYNTFYGSNHARGAAVLEMPEVGVIPDVIATAATANVSAMILLEPYPAAPWDDPNTYMEDYFAREDGHVFDSSVWAVSSNFTANSDEAVSGAGLGLLVLGPNKNSGNAAEIELADTASGFVGCLIRSDNTGLGYRCGWSAEAGGRWEIGTGTDYTLNTLMYVSEPTPPPAGTVVRAVATGPMIRLYVDGVLTVAIADDTYSGNYVGLMTNGVNRLSYLKAFNTTADFEDDFNRPDADPIDGDWNSLVSGDVRIVNNEAIGAVGNNGGMAISTVAIPWADNGEVQIDVSNHDFATVSVYMGLHSTVDEAAARPYYEFHYDTGANRYRVYHYPVGGGSTLVVETGSSSDLQSNTGRFQKIGDTVRYFKNSVQFGSDVVLGAAQDTELGPYLAIRPRRSDTEITAVRGYDLTEVGTPI